MKPAKDSLFPVPAGRQASGLSATVDNDSNLDSRRS